MIWDYCERCGCAIEIGELCYQIGADLYCTDCVKKVDTAEEFKKEMDSIANKKGSKQK